MAVCRGRMAILISLAGSAFAVAPGLFATPGLRSFATPARQRLGARLGAPRACATPSPSGGDAPSAAVANGPNPALSPTDVVMAQLELLKRGDNEDLEECWSYVSPYGPLTDVRSARTTAATLATPTTPHSAMREHRSTTRPPDRALDSSGRSNASLAGGRLAGGRWRRSTDSTGAWPTPPHTPAVLASRKPRERSWGCASE